MKKYLIIAALIPLIVYGLTGDPVSSGIQGCAKILFGLLLCAPLFGFACLFVMFHRWHRGFHANRVKYGIHRAPRA